MIEVRRRRWRSSLLLVALVGLGSTTSCMTRKVWRDDRTRVFTSWQDEQSQVTAHLDATTPTTVHFEFSPTMAERLAELGALPSPRARWLSSELTAAEHRLLGDKRALRLQVVREEHGPPPHWHLPPFLLPKLTPRREDSTPRRVHVAEVQPGGLGRALPAPDLEAVTIRDDGRWLVTKLLLTPPAASSTPSPTRCSGGHPG